MFKWLFHILIFATNICGKCQNKEKPLKRQRKLGLHDTMLYLFAHGVVDVMQCNKS